MSTRLHTFTGAGFDPHNPRPEDVRLEDIAHALANTCRFGGHTPRYYSVAQHAVLVASMVLETSDRADWAMLALHHDSAEAYLGDIPLPLKHGMVLVREIHSIDDGKPVKGYVRLPIVTAEAEIYSVILAALGLFDDIAAHDLIRQADDGMLVSELRGLFNAAPDQHTGRQVMQMPPIAPHQCQAPHEAKASFIAMHAALLKMMGCV